MKSGFCYVLAFFVVLCASCKDHHTDAEQNTKPIDSEKLTQEKPLIPNKKTSANTIETRISCPDSFVRQGVETNSFQAYLRSLPLKAAGAKVHYYNGNTKPKNGVYTDVVDLAIGKKDLHQCADAVMRLRAEYLWKQKKYEDIHFNFTNGHKVAYKEWMSGKRMKIEGNKTWWLDKHPPSNTYQDFWNYMELIFMYAGTASLEKELHSTTIENAAIGDVLIQGGHPGHAVIIVDKAIHEDTGEAIYLLAQSYMPAQEIQILLNPVNKKISPWFQLQSGNIQTPEWNFTSTDLKRF